MINMGSNVFVATTSPRRCLWPAVSGLFLLALLAVGCSKQDSAPKTDPSTSTAPPSPRGPGWGTNTAAPAAIAPGADINATLDQLTVELRKYVVHSRSVPRTFEEFVAKSQLQVPDAPTGKKYAIRNQAVVLVNR
jgi:hypothetical protein